jgi:hypothetical protein
MRKSRYRNLSWSPKPKDWPDDFDGGVVAETGSGTYGVKPISNRIAGSTLESWFNEQVFVATFESKDGDTLLLTPAPTERQEAHSAVMSHYHKACDEQEKNNE